MITQTLIKVFTNIYFYITLLCIALAISVTTCRHNKSDLTIQEQNTSALLGKVDTYSNQIGTLSATVERLTLSVKELKEFKPEMARKLDSMGIKLNRLESVSQSDWKVKYIIETKVKDSIRNVSGKIDTIKCINYKNKFLILNGCDDNGQFTGTIQDIVPIIQTVQRVPHRFLFFRWGTKAVTQTVQSLNPFAKVTFDQYIEFSH